MNVNGETEVDDFIRNLQLIAFLTRHYLESRFVDDVTDKPISFVHMNLLRVLDSNPGQTVGDIAKFMNVSYPAATKTIDKLVRLGLLRRREDTHDRRIAHLHLTSSGKKMVDKYIDLKRVKMLEIIDKFGQDKMHGLRTSMNQFAREIVDTIPIKAGICMQCGAFSPDHCYPTEEEKKCGYLESTRGD